MDVLTSRHERRQFGPLYDQPIATVGFVVGPGESWQRTIAGVTVYSLPVIGSLVMV